MKFARKWSGSHLQLWLEREREMKTARVWSPSCAGWQHILMPPTVHTHTPLFHLMDKLTNCTLKRPFSKFWPLFLCSNWGAVFHPHGTYMYTVMYNSFTAAMWNEMKHLFCAAWLLLSLPDWSNYVYTFCLHSNERP